MKYFALGVSFGLIIIFVVWAAWNMITSSPTLHEKHLAAITISQISPTPAFLPQAISDIDSVFDDDSWTATLSAERVTRLVATGDVLPARTVNYKTITYEDFRWAFTNISSLLFSGDITLINLETPLLKNCPITNTGMIFCGDSRHIEGLIYSGVDVANIANNHIANHGEQGVGETINLLANVGIQVSGLTRPAVIEHNDITYAFLGYNDIYRQAGVQHVEDGTFEEDIAQAKALYDIVVVSFHWGSEYRAQPDERSVEIAHNAIDAGADLVIGNHPHWIQPVEIYRGKFITYAHGNTIFDQMWSQKTREGVVGTYTFYDDQLIDVSFTPLVIEDFGQPRIAEGQEGSKIMESMKRESEKRVN